MYIMNTFYNALYIKALSIVLPKMFKCESRYCHF